MDEGDFSHIKNYTLRRQLESTYLAVTETDSWDVIHDDDKLIKIIWECEKSECYHTDSSWSYCIQVMRKIANDGWENYILGK